MTETANLEPDESEFKAGDPFGLTLTSGSLHNAVLGNIASGSYTINLPYVSTAASASISWPTITTTLTTGTTTSDNSLKPLFDKETPIVADLSEWQMEAMRQLVREEVREMQKFLEYMLTHFELISKETFRALLREESKGVQHE